MPSSLDPGLLARLLAAQSGQPFTDSGTAYQRLDQFGGPGGESGYGQDMGYGGAISYNPDATKPGDEFNVYGPGGEFSNTGQFKDMSGLDPLLLAFLAAAGGMAAFLPGGFAAGSAAGGGLGAAEGVSGAAFGDAGLMYGGADAAAAGGLGAAEGAGLGSTAYGATGGPSAFMQGAGIAGGGTGAASALTGSSALTSGLTAGSGGLLGSLGAMGSLLGPAAMLAGAAAGGKGSNQSATKTQDIPEWLKPYVTGNDGVLNYASNLLKQQMQPGALGGYSQMQNLGQSLMSRPVAGNGFNQQFFGAR